MSEAVPVQNQAAAQKLLQKMSQPDNKEMNPRFRKHKFRAKQEEAVVFTLDEWERTKGTKLNPMLNSGMQDTIHDEELARQLQDQLDFEDSYVSIVTGFLCNWGFIQILICESSGENWRFRS